jgi:hypothetical protein
MLERTPDTHRAAAAEPADEYGLGLPTADHSCGTPEHPGQSFDARRVRHGRHSLQFGDLPPGLGLQLCWQDQEPVNEPKQLEYDVSA